MHLGMVTYNVAKDWDLDTLLKLLSANGWEGVEFRTTHAHGVEPSLTASERSTVRAKCSDAGMKQVSLGSVCEFHSPDPTVVAKNVEECKRFVSLAKDIGAVAVKVRPNGLPEGVPQERTIAQIGQALRDCGVAASDQGVQIWLEVHGQNTSLPHTARAIMDACGHGAVGVTWNSNPTDVVDGSVRNSFKLLGRHVRCCHITDLWSEYPWRELFALLKEARYQGFTLCEVGTPLAAASAVPFLRCYRGLWKELAR